MQTQSTAKLLQRPTMSKLYLLSVTLMPQSEGLDIVSFFKKLDGLVQDYSNLTKILYKFKVTGEPQVLSIIEVNNVIGMERTIAGLHRLGCVSVSCSPLDTYENFATFLGVESPLTSTIGSLPQDNLYWLDFDVEAPGKPIPSLVETWKKEAIALLTARAKGLQVIAYKVIMERKVHCFLSMADPSKLDQLSFTLPIMTENGENIRIKCKAIQHLGDFVQMIQG